ncbi:hypothetical protein HEP84_40650 [Streptomyces sp. RLB1-33]|uniref:hypothetical protein n=1 Tax=Streptomyces mirabilis TaxID=68239 RepID=UPI00143E1F0B|nr:MULTISPECIES: hypothetical protein [Streptomyces]QIY74484.1 hypothetical protein HEP84_40650 [Streptomyces sp. RLB1-33]QUW78378.1 hypothetical protein SMIR_03845 [Streptomyces mirabilis]
MSSVALLADPAVGAASAGAAGRMMAFLDHFAGVFTLLSLTAVVTCGLAATDRLVLTPRLRVAVQSVHRASAVAALGFLVTHIAVKVVERHAAPQTAVVPFTGGAALAASLGTIAADLLALIMATGVLRGRFAGSRPWLWRVLHSMAYVCWPISLAHGLTAGRKAHAWVLWGYGLCAALVALVLLVRVLSCLGRHRTLSRRRRSAKAYRPAAVRPAALAALSKRSARPSTGVRPLAWAARPVPPTTAARRSAPGAGLPGQPKHAARPGPRPLYLAQPGGSE